VTDSVSASGTVTIFNVCCFNKGCFIIDGSCRLTVFQAGFQMLTKLVVVSGPVDKQHDGEPHCTLVLSSDTDLLEVHNNVSNASIPT